MSREIKRFAPEEEKKVVQITRKLGHLQAWIFRKTGGRLGNTFLFRTPVLLLTTKGRKTGQMRTVPLAYLKNDDQVVVVGSKVGCSTHPLWYLNLLAEPVCTLQVGSELEQRTARVANKEEVEILWPKLLKVYKGFDDYKARAGDANREIPVIILEKPENIGFE